ncbi:MAG: L,D-transpeptidase family protein [Sphingomicrobium sp.]
MRSKSVTIALGLAGAASAAVVMAQTTSKPAAAKPDVKTAATSTSSSSAGKGWAAPGTPGSPITGELFHAQVLLDAAGFSPGPIDGKKGQSLDQALRGFQIGHGLAATGKLDGETRGALLQGGRPSTVMVRLGPDDVRSQYIYPLPKDPALQEKLPFLGYRNMLEKVAERYHTTPDTVIALNGPTALIGPGQTLRLPNVIPTSRDYSGVQGEGAKVMNLLNVDARQPQGDYIVVDKSEGVLKVYRGTAPAGPEGAAGKGDDESGKPKIVSAPAEPNAAPAGQLVAQFPVTIGSTHDPLPVGNWKVTTYAFLPPFHYQPNLFWDAKDKATEHMLPAGPNGPVGVAWLDLTKEHYGIHGTPEPSTIGRAESHGCIRMTNWDVMRLARMMKPGFKAVFQA